MGRKPMQGLIDLPMQSECPAREVCLFCRSYLDYLYPLRDKLQQLCEVMAGQLHLGFDENCGYAIDVAPLRGELVVSQESKIGLRIIRPVLDLPDTGDVTFSHLLRRVR